MVISMVNMMGMLMVMVLVDGTWHCQGDDSDHDDGRDTGDGEILILVNMMVKMMVMLVVIIIFMTVAITMMMNLVNVGHDDCHDAGLGDCSCASPLNRRERP